MSHSRKKNYLGFGFGAVQAGLMLFEAVKSGHFERTVILEINPSLVEAVRKNNHSITVNTATDTGIKKTKISNIEIYNPLSPKDHTAIKDAIYEADEMSTAVPSVDFYDSKKNASIASLLGTFLNTAKRQILYASENNNYAAEILADKISSNADKNKMESFQILNTVIGKMGGVIQDRATINELNLDTIIPNDQNAILVESFNKIIVSKVTFQGYIRGIDVFEEKNELLPFEEAKLFGHNAIHSMLGYMAYLKNYRYMSEIRDDPDLYDLGKEAFLDESGATLIKKYSHLNTIGLQNRQRLNSNRCSFSFQGRLQILKHFRQKIIQRNGSKQAAQ